MTIADRIQIRRDTAANWTSANPILLLGEQGLETDTGKTKFGDNVTAWTSLAYGLDGLYAPLRTFDLTTYRAKGDGTTDDTTNVQAALTACQNAGTGIIWVPAGKTFLCTDLTFPTAGNFVVDGGGTIKQKFVSGDNHYLASVNPNSGGTTNPDQNSANITFRNITFQGTVATDGFMEHVYLLNLNAVSHVLVENCVFQGFRGDGIYLGSGNTASIERHNVDVIIRGCVFDGVNHSNRDAISIIDGTGIWIEDNRFRNCSTTTMPGAIDIEPNATTYPRTQNIHISRNHFETQGPNTSCVTLNLRAQSGLTTPVRGIYITDNYMDLTDQISATGNFGITLSNQPEQTVADDTTIPHDITVRGNKIIGGRKAFKVYGMRGVNIDENYVDGTWDASDIGDIGAQTDDLRMRRNHFRRISPDGSTNGAGLYIYDNLRLVIEDNDFDDIGISAGGFGIGIMMISGATTNYVQVKGNRFYGSRQTASLTMSGHTTTAANNDWLGNRDLTSGGRAAAFGRGTVTATYDPPSLANGVSATTTVTVTGAATGDFVQATHSSVVAAGTGWTLTGYVSAANTVKVVLVNNTGGTIDLASGTLTVNAIRA